MDKCPNCGKIYYNPKEVMEIECSRCGKPYFAPCCIAEGGIYCYPCEKIIQQEQINKGQTPQTLEELRQRCFGDFSAFLDEEDNKDTEEDKENKESKFQPGDIINWKSCVMGNHNGQIIRKWGDDRWLIKIPGGKEYTPSVRDLTKITDLEEVQEVQEPIKINNIYTRDEELKMKFEIGDYVLFDDVPRIVIREVPEYVYCYNKTGKIVNIFTTKDGEKEYQINTSFVLGEEEFLYVDENVIKFPDYIYTRDGE